MISTSTIRILVLIMWAGVLVSCSTRDPFPPRSELDISLAPGPCAACGPIVLVPLVGSRSGVVDETYVETLARDMRETYGLDVEARSAVSMPGRTFDSSREQYDGDGIIAFLKDEFPGGARGTTVIALMNEGLFLSSTPEWNWAFGSRETQEAGGGWAVISADTMGYLWARRRMAVMLGKYIGGSACGFAPSLEAKSIMYSRIRAAEDLDWMSAVVCAPLDADERVSRP